MAKYVKQSGLKTHHKIGISIFLIIKLLLIISVIYLAHTLVQVKYEFQQQINQTQKELSTQISELETTVILNQKVNQGQITEIRDTLSTTTLSLESQFAELKASASSDFSGIIQEVIPGVVTIGTDISQGSGFLISNDGYIITNAHVLSDSSYAKVLTYDSSVWQNSELVGYNDKKDIAILKISGTYNYLEFGDSNDIQIGEKTIAIGNPMGLSFSVTEGIISQINREGPNGDPIYIQIDTPLNAGNSGGPLINKQGKVIGINNFKIKDSENLGFALESNSAISSINNILSESGETIRI